jgi:hypothetical protein|tara:strand:+ start:319 stop:540 length:222 start_codon:yes stop_codon:yes gene_type:complete
MSTKKRSYEEMNEPAGGGVGGVPPVAPSVVPTPVTKSISKVRSDLLNMVQQMVEGQRIKVEKLRIEATCNGEI